MREFAEINRASVDDYLDVCFSAYKGMGRVDEKRTEYLRNNVLADIDDAYDSRFFGLYENSQMIAAMKIVDLSMNIFGKLQQATGLMSMAIRPEFVNGEVVSQMISYFESFVKDSDSNIALLFPGSVEVSKKYGYGNGTRMEEYNIPIQDLPAADDISKLRFLTKEDLWNTLKYHENFARHNHTALMKCIQEIRDMQNDADILRISYVDNGHIRGYISYKFVVDEEGQCLSRHIAVDEMVYESRDILKFLLGYLKIYAKDADHVTLDTEEENFTELLNIKEDADAPRELIVSDMRGVMGKVLSPMKFVAHTKYRKLPLANIIVEIEISDEMAGMDKAMKLRFSEDRVNGCSRWSVAQADVTADVKLQCTGAAATSLMLGTVRLPSLIRSGQAKISDSQYTLLLDKLFYSGDECDAEPEQLNS